MAESLTQKALRLPNPAPGQDAAEIYVTEHLLKFCNEPKAAASLTIRGGQSAADNALQRLNLDGYATKRANAYPNRLRKGSVLSPYIRHGMLSLDQVCKHVTIGGFEPEDIAEFKHELLWQEYARHWYARLGNKTSEALRSRQLETVHADAENIFDTQMGCLEVAIGELEEDGWIPNQVRKWLASHWTVRHGGDWRDGEAYLQQHLIDGSPAANRLGWQIASGAGSGRSAGFSRWQVEKYAPGLCASCEVVDRCPISDWADEPTYELVKPDSALTYVEDLVALYGPTEEHIVDEAEAVWLGQDSLGARDPALVANPHLPAVFVFDEDALTKLKPSSKRLVFLVETLSELAVRAELQIFVGKPEQVLGTKKLASTFAPVPAWKEKSDQLNIVRTYPWPWLVRPAHGSVETFGLWRQSHQV